MRRACLVLSMLTIALAACADNPRVASGPNLIDCIPKPTLKDVFACTQGEQASASEAKPAAEKTK
jgi:hypothetical protein